MKIELVILLILDAFKAAKAEIRHHQYPKDNNITFPWSSTTQHRTVEIRKVTEVTNPKQQWGVTSPEDVSPKFYSQKLLYDLDTFFEDGRDFNSTASAFKNGGNDRRSEKKKEVLFLTGKNGKRNTKLTNKFLEIETSTKSSSLESSDFRFLNPVYVKRKRNDLGIAKPYNSRQNASSQPETSNKNRVMGEKINSDKKNYPENFISYGNNEKGQQYKSLNLFRKISNLHFPEPLVASTDVVESDGCVENVVEDFIVSDHLVHKDVLTDRNDAQRRITDFVANKENTDKVTDLMKSVLENSSKVSSVSVTVHTVQMNEKSKMSRTVYRQEDNLLVVRQSNGYPEFLSDEKTSWTPLFRNCLTKTWIFGCSFYVENSNIRIDATVYFNANSINGTVDQCKASFRQILKGGPKCELSTTKCAPLSHSGFKIGGYKCICRNGYYFPNFIQSKEKYFNGSEMEKTSNSSFFKCLPCPDLCPNSCSASGHCIYQRNKFLTTCILSIQITCILITSILITLVFRHRKCKTIATGMWTIIEMILIGSLFLYGTVIIRTFDPSTTLCLIEPWYREMGFVLCYGAIILKLYRILIEFRTRKAHRWVIRDKDLLKYLLGMVIVVFGYMSAWTATNFYHIERENYNMLTTGVTSDGFHFNACKPIWWDYITEIGEILILLFGIHLSYASRNATTQFRERCFLCISISIEAFISGIFYILRTFYWDVTMHPDLSLLANFGRCQFTTSIVIFLLLTPKWWYQKVQINKCRVSRNYLTQELSRGPLDAFKPQDGVTATNSDVEGEISLADMNPEDIRAELKRLYTQLEVLKNKTIRFDNPHISKRRGGRKIAHRRFSLQALRNQAHRVSSKNTDIEVTEAEASRTPEDSVCSNEGPSFFISDGPSDIVHMTPKKNQK